MGLGPNRRFGLRSFGSDIAQVGGERCWIGIDCGVVGSRAPEVVEHGSTWGVSEVVGGAVHQIRAE